MDNNEMKSEKGTITIRKINDYIYMLRDNEDSNTFVVLGTKKALVIDTMNGTEDIKRIVENLTNLPITLFNTHAHPDHVGGNYYFEEALIHPSDIVLGNMFLPEPGSEKAVGRTEYKWIPILPGDTVELGDLSLEVISLAGHTPGSIGLLDRKSRILFSGDGVNEYLWMQLDHCLPLRKLLQTLYDLQKYRDEFDYILTSHATGLVEASHCEELAAAIEDMLAGENEDDFDTEFFGGMVKGHPYGNGKTVVYDPKRPME